MLGNKTVFLSFFSSYATVLYDGFFSAILFYFSFVSRIGLDLVDSLCSCFFFLSSSVIRFQTAVALDATMRVHKLAFLNQG